MHDRAVMEIGSYTSVLAFLGHAGGCLLFGRFREQGGHQPEIAK
jgi:hypothetical protein